MWGFDAFPCFTSARVRSHHVSGYREEGWLVLVSPWEDGRRIYGGLRWTEAFVTMRTTQKRQVCILLPNKQHLDCTVRVSVLNVLFISYRFQKCIDPRFNLKLTGLITWLILDILHSYHQCASITQGLYLNEIILICFGNSNHTSSNSYSQQSGKASDTAISP